MRRVNSYRHPPQGKRLKMIGDILNSKVKTIGAVAIILAFAALASRFLGLVREWLLASTFGAGSDLDAYFVAFRIPDFIYNVLITGGIVSIFLPLFSEYFPKDKAEAWRFTNNIFNIFLFLLSIMCLVLFILAPFIIKLIAPGFSKEQIELATSLARIMMLSPVLFTLYSVFAGVLQYFNKFIIYSLGPIIYNLGIIFGIIFLSPYFGISGVSMGVILGAFVFLAVQIPFVIESGFNYKFILDFKDKKIHKFFKLMIPRVFASASLEIETVAFVIIASTLGVGAISIFNFANDLQFIPIGIVTISLVVATFTTLSKLWAEGEKEKFIKTFSSVFRQILFLIVPISFLMLALREQIVAIILRHGNFTFQDAALASACLGIFCLGLFAYSATFFIVRTFYTLQDTKTPTLITSFVVFLTVSLAIFFAWLFNNSEFARSFLISFFALADLPKIALLGLPLAFSIGSVIHLGLSMTFLYRKIGDYNLREIANSAWRVFVSGILMLVAINIGLYLISPIFDIKTFAGAFWQLIILGSAGAIIYIASSFLLRSPEIFVFKEKIFKKFKG